ncbi:MAG: hypothetical protein AAF961_08670, partial [Planctomycetota bacterium]
LGRRAAARLARFVHDGGGLVVTGGESMTAGQSALLADAGVLRGRVRGGQRAAATPFRIGQWNSNHSILKPFDDPQHGDLRGLTFNAYSSLEATDSAEVLATFHDGSPALADLPYGRGRALWFAGTLNLAWGDLPRSPLFVPLVHQMLGYLTGLTDGGPVRTAVVQNSSTPESQERYVAPGIHMHDDHCTVVNVNPRESEVERCTIADFRNRFGIAEETTTVDSPNFVPVAGAARLEFRRGEIWHWVLVALVAVAAAEFFLANRATA